MQLSDVLQNQFKRLSVNELEQVWQWRNKPHIRQNMHNKNEISWQDHKTWFKQLQRNADSTYLVLWQNNRPVGSLYFTKDQNSLNWGCYLGELNVWPGSGLLLEISALDYAAAQPEIQYLYAEALSFNLSVLKLHQLFEYDTLPDKTGGSRDNQPYQVRCFQYPLQRWQSERERILAKLPPAIRQAANQIIFSDK